MVENFYGNKANKIVHDLSNEKPKCEIKSIKIYNKRYFMPDTYEQAVSEGFTNCPFCIKDDSNLIKDGGHFTVERNMPKLSEIEKNQEEEKTRIKASKAVRRSGGSKKESKIKKSKAKTKEKRSSKKIATVRKRRQ